MKRHSKIYQKALKYDFGNIGNNNKWVESELDVAYRK